MLLAITRMKMIRKTETHTKKKNCSEFGMKVSQVTTFFVINSCDGDDDPLSADEVIVNSFTSNLHLGSAFTCD